MITDDIYQLISEHQLVATIKLLGDQLNTNEYVTVELRDRYHSAKRILETMLHYLESPIQDPELSTNYQYLLRTLYEVTDMLRDKEWMSESTYYEKQSKYYSLLLDNGGLISVAEPLIVASDLSTTDRARYDDLVSRLSMGLLYTHDWSDELASLLDQMDDYVQQTALTSVTLALMRSWHWGKLLWLVSKVIATKGTMSAVRARAVVGAILIGESYSSRLELYESQLPYSLQQIGASITLEEYDMVWTHRLRMKYTPQVIEYVQKLFGRFNSPEFQERFQEIISSAGDLSAQKSFDSSMDDEELLPLVEDVQDGYKALKRLVSRGFDVNAFASSTLLQGSFFDCEAHWLIPFDLDHSTLEPVMAQFREHHQLGADQLMMLLRESTFQQVDIDYYGTIFRLNQLPPQILQGISQGVIAMENVVNRTHYVAPQSVVTLEAEEYTKALQGYICQLSRIFAIKGKKIVAEAPFEIHFGRLNPFAQSQTEELYDKHLGLLRDYCAQVKQYEGEQAAIQFQIMRTIDPRARAGLMYRIAQIYYQEQKYMEAYFVMQQIPPQLLTGDSSPHFIAQILYRMDQAGLAINLLENVRQQSDPTLSTVRLLGILYMKVHLYDKALPLLLKCEFEDSHPDTLYPMIAWCLMMAHRWDEAKAYASRPSTSYDQLAPDSLEHDYKALRDILPALLTLISGDLQGTLESFKILLASAETTQYTAVVSAYSECIYDLLQIGVPVHLLELIQTWLARHKS